MTIVPSSNVPGPSLERIYSRIEPYYVAAYLAEAVYTCGIRQVSWVAGISATIEVLNQDVLAALAAVDQRQLINMRLDLTMRLDRSLSSFLCHVQSDVLDILDHIHHLLTHSMREGFEDLWRLQLIFRI